MHYYLLKAILNEANRLLLSALRDNASNYLLMYMYYVTLMVWKLNVRHGPDVPIDEYEVCLQLRSHRD